MLQRPLFLCRFQLRLFVCLLAAFLLWPLAMQAQVENESDAREMSRRAERDSLRRIRQEERRRAFEAEERRRTDDELRRDIEGDSAGPKEMDFRVRPGERFDLFFLKGFLLTGALPDSAPATALSGSNFLGASFNFVLTRRWAVKAGLGVNFFRLVFQTNDAKRFPSRGDTTTSEKLRAFYLESPIGIQYVLKRNEQGKILSYTELGATIGYNFYTDYKFTQDLPGGFSSTGKIENIQNFERWRYTAYGKIAYRYFTFWASYRLSDVFREDARYDPTRGALGTAPGDRPSARYPEIPRLELGIGFVL